jgi:hypothetical protein
VNGQWRRSWLHPRWYVTAGGGAARPDTLRIIDTPPGPVNCTRCGREDLDIWSRHPDGDLCNACDGLLHPARPAGWLRRAWWWLDRRDALYWAYCERIGRRVPHPGDPGATP